MSSFLKSIIVTISLAFTTLAYAKADPLPSWNEGPIKKKIISFVAEVTDKSNAHYVAPDDRIATIDNDGTLWIEQPIYTQAFFMFDRLHQLVKANPSLKNKKPYSLIVNQDPKKLNLNTLTVQDIEQMIAVTHSGMTVEEFQHLATTWLATAKNSHFNRLYTDLVYQPMLELLQYLRKHNFTIYIVTGGGQDFVRAYSAATYHVLPDRVIGTAIKTQYSDQNNHPTLVKTAKIFFVDDKKGKPEAINLFIGKKPILAFGNSDGDREMLEWTQSGEGARLMVLVHHDDAIREFAYGPQSKVGTFSDSLMQEAEKNHWQVISMKNDWKDIFPIVNHLKK